MMNFLARSIALTLILPKNTRNASASAFQHLSHSRKSGVATVALSRFQDATHLPSRCLTSGGEFQLFYHSVKTLIWILLLESCMRHRNSTPKHLCVLFEKQNPTIALAATSSEKAAAPEVIPGRPTWQQTMLRIADPKKTIPFYEGHMGMTLIDTLDFPQYDFKLYFMATLPEGEEYNLIPGTKEAHVSEESTNCFDRISIPC
jgi:hypothetical protein